MILPDKTKLPTRTVRNPVASLTVDAFGGGLIDFHLHDSKINPLSCKFTQEQMPLNNRSGAPYQGHFLCLGRWGKPSIGETKAGIPDHGHFANIMWNCTLSDQRTLSMNVQSELEGLRIDRTIQMDDHVGLYLVDEMVMNVNPLGRLYNMVQHPTMAAPFLDNKTKIQCNASKGFHYKNYHDPEKYASIWPYGIDEDETICDLRFCDKGHSAVFSFIISDYSRYGWITAYSPGSQLLMGYLWLRKDYPWINLWKDWDKGCIRYCGLEFGTTGIHQPFMEILEQGKSTVFNNNTFEYIDAGEAVCRKYISFLVETAGDFDEVESVSVENGSINIKARNTDIIKLNSDLTKAVVN